MPKRKYNYISLSSNIFTTFLVIFLVVLTVVVIYQHLTGAKVIPYKPILSEIPKKKKIPPKKFQSEEECRNIIKLLTNQKFPKERPSFLKYPKTGNNLELDGFNNNLKIAFEYNGKQHYCYTPFFHKNYEDFLEQQRHDEFKKKICSLIGIHLIVIPYDVPNVTKYIYDELLKIEKNQGLNLNK